MKAHIGAGFDNAICTKGFEKTPLRARSRLEYTLYVKDPVLTFQQQALFTDEDGTILDVLHTPVRYHPMILDIGI